MSEMILALSLTLILLAAMFLWVPGLNSATALANRHPLERSNEVPDLVEEDASPQFTGEVA